MRNSQPLAALNSTLQFVLASDIPAQHRTVLVEMLTQALSDQEAGSSLPRGEVPPGWEWQPHEVMMVRSSLEDSVATSWQHADEMVMRLAAQLHRDSRSVRAKATELGLSAAVDYRVARALIQGADE